MIKNAEYFLKGGRAGILLIHGLTGTPKEMAILARGLNQFGFTVYGMQLAGHCGDEDDLLQTTWQDWYKTVELAANKLRESVDHLFVGGLSMGAILALKYAAENPEKVAGVGVYGPTFKYDGWAIPAYARKLGFLLGWVKPLKLLGLFKSRVFAEQPPYGLKDVRLRAMILESMKSGDSTSAGLAGNPWPSVAEMMELAAITKRKLHQVAAPCLIMHAAVDDIADIENSRLVARSVSGDSKLVALEDSYHMITIDREHRKVIAESASYFQQIINQSTRDAVNGSIEADIPLAIEQVA